MRRRQYQPPRPRSPITAKPVDELHAILMAPLSMTTELQLNLVTKKRPKTDSSPRRDRSAPPGG